MINQFFEDEGVIEKAYDKLDNSILGVSGIRERWWDNTMDRWKDWNWL